MLVRGFRGIRRLCYGRPIGDLDGTNESDDGTDKNALLRSVFIKVELIKALHQLDCFYEV